MKQRITCVVGTRPEVIKMAPVILALRGDPSSFDAMVLATAQHRDMLDQALAMFGLRADVDLDLMRPDQAVGELTGRVLAGLGAYLAAHRPDAVLAQGDTTTVMATAMACFFAGIPFGHVEAGLRSFDLRAPWPEEYNRRVAAVGARWHFAPTPGAAENLRREGVGADRIFVTGNTIVDALRHILAHTPAPPPPVPAGRPFVLMTCHRRESFGEPIRAVFRAVRDFASRHPDAVVWYPVHPNPGVRGPAAEILGGLENVRLADPVDYVTLLHAMKACRLVLTDSGGMQEEGVTLGKRVLVLRDVTERPEAVESGLARLVGNDGARVAAALEQAWAESGTETAGSAVFGDGHAAGRIAGILRDQKERS